jgi:hypothetical protein
VGSERVGSSGACVGELRAAFQGLGITEMVIGRASPRASICLSRRRGRRHGERPELQCPLASGASRFESVTAQALWDRIQQSFLPRRRSMLNCPIPRALVHIVAYRADRTSASVVRRIPRDPSTRYDIDVLVMSGSSADAPCPSRALHNPMTQKYGGNLKLAYHCAIRNNCRAGRRPE